MIWQKRGVLPKLRSDIEYTFLIGFPNGTLAPKILLVPKFRP
jgi:hypothetical protein